MGPSCLFDKSFLQSLSVDESVWFDAYFSGVISPFFYVETLADLSKENTRTGRSAEDEVKIIAEKFPDFCGTPCVHHRLLALNDLMGVPPPLTGQIPIPGGRQVRRPDGTIGAVVERFLENEAFSRWQEQRFLDLERDIAKRWRDQLLPLDMDVTSKLLKEIGLGEKHCKSLEEARQVARQIVGSKTAPFAQGKLLFDFLAFSERERHGVLRRWAEVQYRTLGKHAPYAAHLLEVEIFFHLAIRSSLISHERPSNRIDIGYLYYLPFCHLFVSSDRLHKRCAPLFLRPDQKFIWGPDLKAEMARVNSQLLLLPAEARAVGVLQLARAPVGEDSDLLVALWDEFAPGWRRSKSIPTQSAGSERLIQAMNAEIGAPRLPEDEYVSAEELESVSIQRSVRAKKGSWVQIPGKAN